MCQICGSLFFVHLKYQWSKRVSLCFFLFLKNENKEVPVTVILRNTRKRDIMLNQETAAHLQQVITEIKLAKANLFKALASAETDPESVPSVPVSGLRPASSNVLEELHRKLKDLQAFEDSLIELLINQTVCAYVVALIAQEGSDRIEKKIFAVSREFPQVIIRGIEIFELRGMRPETDDSIVRVVSIVEKHVHPQVQGKRLAINGPSWCSIGETVSFSAFSTYHAALAWSESPKSERIKRISAH
jgi:hypothetical protein